MSDYLVIYEEGDDGGWGAYSPDVEGVVAVGTSHEEVELRITEALATHLEVIREQGLPAPLPRTVVGYVAA